MSWEGWLVVVVYLAAVLVPLAVVRDGAIGYVVYVIALTAALLLTALAKGTEPGGPAKAKRFREQSGGQL